MLRAILILLVVAVVAILGLALLKPKVLRVVRSATIAAPPQTVFALIEDFRHWPQWSPWEKKDPAMRKTLGGAERGPGATYAWDGDRNVGRGRMEILRAEAPSLVAIKLDFEKPFETHNDVEFRLAPASGGTEVTWSMVAPAPFIGRVMAVFMDMDRMIGRDFEAGLAALKSVAERGALPPSRQGG